MVIHDFVGGEHAADVENVRLLYPLCLQEGSTGEGTGRGSYVGAAVDVETTGLDVKAG